MTTLSIGDTVAFKSHPYNSTSGGKLITSEIIGEHLMTSPLMIVIEILHHSKGSYDDKSGNEILPKKSLSAKCLWYNSSLHQFEEAWLTQKEIKKVACDYDSISITSEEFKDWKDLKHSLVSLRTLKQELGKEKRSKKKDGIKEGYQTTNHLEYVSPVMELIEIRKFEIKESQFDPKTGEKKKELPQYVAKCKWFNPKGNKYSERFLPLEALNHIPEISAEIFNSISEVLDDKNYVYIEEFGKEYLFRPTLLSKSGYYYLSGYNVINNKEESIELDNETTYIPIENPFSETWPMFTADHKLTSIKTFIEANIDVVDYWRIKYENYHGEITSRTITPKAIGTDEISIGGTTSTIKYLTSDCHLRNAERHFRFDRIRSIQIINIPKIPPNK